MSDKNLVIEYCDKCKTPLDVDFTFRDGKNAICHNCYLRLMGYDPEDISRRFAEFAQKVIADIEARKH